tara:strand:+ start:6 stop:326 length:321 start_codon:yes stop_codon:yes gene_type:complete
MSNPNKSSRKILKTGLTLCALTAGLFLAGHGGYKVMRDFFSNYSAPPYEILETAVGSALFIYTSFTLLPRRNIIVNVNTKPPSNTHQTEPQQPYNPALDPRRGQRR